MGSLIVKEREEFYPFDTIDHYFGEYLYIKREAKSFSVANLQYSVVDPADVGKNLVKEFWINREAWPGEGYEPYMVPKYIEELLPESNSTTIKINAGFYDKKGVKVDSASCSTICKVKPYSLNLDVSFSDTTGYLDIYGGYVIEKSKVKIDVSTGYLHGASVKSCIIKCGGQTSIGQTATFDFPRTGFSWSVLVEDSRGRGEAQSTASMDSPLPTVYWAKPSIKCANITRCNSDETKDPNGQYAFVDITGGVTKLAVFHGTLKKQNSSHWYMMKRERGADTWQETELTNIRNALGSVSTRLVFAAEKDKDLEIAFRVEDDFDIVQTEWQMLPAAFSLMDFDRSTKAIGIGVVCGEPETIGMGMPVVMHANRVTDMADPEGDQDAATKGYVDGYVREEVGNVQDQVDAIAAQLQFKRFTFSYKSASISANSSTLYSATNAIPAGWTCFGVIRVDSDITGNVSVKSFNGSSGVVKLMNATSSAKSGVPILVVLIAKDSLSTQSLEED